MTRVIVRVLVPSVVGLFDHVKCGMREAFLIFDGVVVGVFDDGVECFVYGFVDDEEDGVVGVFHLEFSEECVDPVVDVAEGFTMFGVDVDAARRWCDACVLFRRSSEFAEVAFAEVAAELDRSVGVVACDFVHGLGGADEVAGVDVVDGFVLEALC